MLAAVAALFWTCRKTEDPTWRYAVLASATLLTAPYSMYYELVLLVPAVWFVARRAHAAGWLALERESLAVLVLLTLLLPGPATQFGASLCFLASALVAIVIYRRMQAEFAASEPGRSPRRCDPCSRPEIACGLHTCSVTSRQVSKCLFANLFARAKSAA